MKLLRNGRYDGTFSLVIKTAIDNILLDGKPFRARILVKDRRKPLVGTVLEVTADLRVTIDTEAGSTEYIPLNEIEVFEVPSAVDTKRVGRTGVAWHSPRS